MRPQLQPCEPQHLLAAGARKSLNVLCSTKIVLIDIRYNGSRFNTLMVTLLSPPRLMPQHNAGNSSTLSANGQAACRRLIESPPQRCEPRHLRVLQSA